MLDSFESFLNSLQTGLWTFLGQMMFYIMMVLEQMKTYLWTFLEQMMFYLWTFLGQMKFYIMMVLGQMMSYLMVILGPMKTFCMMVLEPMTPYLLKVLVPMKTPMSWITFFFIDQLMSVLAAATIFLTLYLTFAKAYYVSNLPRTTRGARRRARCRICDKVYCRRSVAKRHFAQTHDQRAWKMYSDIFKFCFPPLVVMIGIRYCFDCL